MSNPTPITHSVDAEGIAWIVLDDSPARANVLNSATLSALRGSLTVLAAGATGAASAIKAAVIISGKERIFCGGADLNWLASLPDAGAAEAASRAGQTVFDLIADFPVPVVVAIHGACAGGGCELALAGAWRIATDAPETRIGLPEVGLGLIPGWGGCTRLSRLIGVERAVGFILKAELVPAATALTAGLIDEMVPVEKLKAYAQAAALRLASGAVPPRPEPADFFAAQRAWAPARWPGQPAPVAVLDVMQKSAGLTRAAALECEATLFGHVASGGAAKNLIRLFQLGEKARKSTTAGWYASPAETTEKPPARFRTVGIVGAGVMGAGIAYCCAAQNYGVILCDSNREAIERSVSSIRGLFAAAVSRGEVSADIAHRMTGGIGITTSLEDFEFCDLVIETISEDAGAKQKLFAALSSAVTPGCVLVSNSSALPVEEIAANVANPGRVLGLHFFNPASTTPLVEIALSPQTERAAAERVLAFVKSLGKTPVICRSAPGFFVSRVLFSYLNEACRLLEEGAPADLIEAAMIEGGWKKGPLRTIDGIGLEVTAAVLGELRNYFPGRFAGSTLCERMSAAGLTGRKHDTGAGFYDYAGEREELNPALAKFTAGTANSPTAWDTAMIRDRLIAVLGDETKRALADGVIKTPDDADLALVLGAGFPAVHGGPLRDAK